MSDLRLTPGSRYRITSAFKRDEPAVTEGTFQGITAMGSIDAIVLELGDGDETQTRLIPTHVILSLEVLEAAEAEDGDDEIGSMHYT